MGQERIERVYDSAIEHDAKENCQHAESGKYFFHQKNTLVCAGRKHFFDNQLILSR